MTDTVIRVEHLGKEYRLGTARHDTLRDRIAHGVRGLFRRSRAVREERFWALSDVTFEVKHGEVLGVIGRNGAGKSTLLKILSRITEPTTGRVSIRGRVASLLEVGTGFHPELSGRENIFLNGAILGMSRAEIRRKFDEIVAFAEVERFLETPVKHYSSGMYVRLAFAVAAHLDPEILIVDEVLAVGDAAFQRKCVGKMKDVTGSGRTVLFVSHNQDAIESLCDRGLLLDGGRVSASGPIIDVLQAYRRTFDSTGVIHRTVTPKLVWGGLVADDRLERLLVSDDVKLQMRLRTGHSTIEGEIDCALVNERNEMVVHAKSTFLGRPVKLQGDRDHVVTFDFRKPNLAPGAYTLVVFAKDDRQVLLWVESVPACRVIATSADFPCAPVLPPVTSATVPPFTLTVS